MGISGLRQTTARTAPQSYGGVLVPSAVAAYDAAKTCRTGGNIPPSLLIVLDCLNRSILKENFGIVVSAVPNSGLGRLPFIACDPAGLQPERNASLIETGFITPVLTTERVQ